jgi:hypothetical protein
VKKYVSILLPIAALVIGLVGGWFIAAHFYNGWMASYIKSSVYVDLSGRCRALTALRAGNTNGAAETLETEMTGDILVFGSFLRDTPADKRRPEDIRLLKRVQEYRAAYPRKTADYPDIDKGVADVFALVSTNQSR